MADPGAAPRPLAGRRALVTGAARRLGRAIALGLADRGADVVVHHHRSEAEARDVEREVAERGVRAARVRADLASEAACARALDEAEAALGGIDLLVNNAAVFRRTPLDTLDAAAFDHPMAVNARAVYLLTADAGRRMKAADGGAIVQIADVAGLRPWPGFVPYSASKAAVVSLTGGFALALAPEVRVNAVAPGPILPPEDADPEQGEAAVARTLLGRWGEPADIVAAVAFLATARYLTGVVLAVDGGRSIA